MITTKKALIPEGMSYKEAAALHRAMFSANAKPVEREIRPVNGRIHVVLSGKAIPEHRWDELFGPSKIDIPEFRQRLKKST